MLFNTPQFVITLFIFIVVWYILPKACRKPALLLVNLLFVYLLGGVSTVITLITVTVLTYFCGLMLDNCRQKKIVMGIFIALLVMLLFYGKYTNYILGLINGHLGENGITITVLTLIGVSYYVFSAISYIVDIYNGKDEADKNLLDVALWLMFFTKIIAGPIERHNTFKIQLNRLKDSKFDFENVKRGLMICALGYFYKIIIADRVGIFVDAVYGNLEAYAGITLFITMILYSLQIYFDFAGYSMIAQGVSYAINLRIVKNFDHPYFSSSIAEFWRRWQISLSSWLKDYVYIPLGGNRKGKIRQYVNLMITFLVSGAWHGAGFSYLIWGGLHGIYQIVEKKICIRERISRNWNIVITFMLVSFAWIFFRANSAMTALRFIRQMFQWNPWVLTDGTLTSLGLDILDWSVLLIALVASFIVELIQLKGISLYETLMNKNLVARWLVYYAIFVILLIFGIYGATYDASNFIYFQY